MHVSGTAASQAGMRNTHTSQTLAVQISGNQSSTVLNNSQAMDIQTPMPENDEMSNSPRGRDEPGSSVENEELTQIKKS